jgi:hypothetical protein
MSLRKTLTPVDSLKLDSVIIETVPHIRFLGITLDNHLSFSIHVKNIVTSARRKIYGLLVLKRSGVHQQSLLHMYVTQIMPVLTYAAPSWFPMLSETSVKSLERVQKLALRVCFPVAESYTDYLATSGLERLEHRLQHLCRQYITHIRSRPSHRLFSRLPSTQTSSARRHSSRVKDAHILYNRTKTRDRSIFSNSKYLY